MDRRYVYAIIFPSNFHITVGTEVCFLKGDIQYFSFSCTAWWSDNHILYKVIPQYFQYPPGTVCSYCNIIIYIPSAVPLGLFCQ